MHELILISESIGSLQKLAKKQTIFLNGIPEKFRDDLKNYITGETLSMREGKLLLAITYIKNGFPK